MFYSEFSCWNLWLENGHGFAEDETCFFHLLVREIAAALRRPGAFYGALPQTPPAFLSEKSGAKELDFSCFTLSLHD